MDDSIAAAHAPEGPDELPVTYYDPSESPPSADLASIISHEVQSAVAAAGPARIVPAERFARLVAVKTALDAASSARATALATAAEARRAARSGGRDDPSGDRRIDDLIAMRAVGVDATYVNALRAISPRLRALAPADFTGMKAVGVTPDFARGLAAAGFHDLGQDDLTAARAIGLTSDYARALAAAGLPLDIDDYVQVRAVGVPVDYIARLRRARQGLSADRIIELWTLGLRPEDLNDPGG